MGQPAADVLELFAAVGEAHMQGARNPVEIENSGAQPCLGCKGGTKPGDRMGRTVCMCRIIWPIVEIQSMRVAQQQQADMKIGIGRANGRIVQEHGGNFEQGSGPGQGGRNTAAGSGVALSPLRYREHCMTTPGDAQRRDAADRLCAAARMAVSYCSGHGFPIFCTNPLYRIVR